MTKWNHKIPFVLCKKERKKMNDEKPHLSHAVSMTKWNPKIPFVLPKRERENWTLFDSFLTDKLASFPVLAVFFISATNFFSCNLISHQYIKNSKVHLISIYVTTSLLQTSNCKDAISRSIPAKKKTIPLIFYICRIWKQKHSCI